MLTIKFSHSSVSKIIAAVDVISSQLCLQEATHLTQCQDLVAASYFGELQPHTYITYSDINYKWAVHLSARHSNFSIMPQGFYFLSPSFIIFKTTSILFCLFQINEASFVVSADLL